MIDCDGTHCSEKATRAIAWRDKQQTIHVRQLCDRDADRLAWQLLDLFDVDPVVTAPIDSPIVFSETIGAV
jgi:hypothetical protein